MKSSKILFLFVTGLLGSVVNADVANENVPMVTDGVADLEQYLFGGVDSNGQTILHRIAANCDNDNFTVRLKLFDFIENADKSESAQKFKEEMQALQILQAISPDLAMIAIMEKANNFVQIKDNADDTAFDIAKKRNTLNPHKRCGICVEYLNIFDELDKKINKK